MGQHANSVSKDAQCGAILPSVSALSRKSTRRRAEMGEAVHCSWLGGERAVFVANCAIDGVKTYSLVELGESAGVDGRAENEYAGIAEQFARDL